MRDGRSGTGTGPQEPGISCHIRKQGCYQRLLGSCQKIEKPTQRGFSWQKMNNFSIRNKKVKIHEWVIILKGHTLTVTFERC